MCCNTWAPCMPLSYLFPSRIRIHFCCSNRLLSSPNKNSRQLLHFSLSKSANSTTSLFNPAEQIHRPHPLFLKCFKETILKPVCKGNKLLRVSNTSYCLLHEMMIPKGGLISNSNKAEKGVLLHSIYSEEIICDGTD